MAIDDREIIREPAQRSIALANPDLDQEGRLRPMRGGQEPTRLPEAAAEPDGFAFTWVAVASWLLAGLVAWTVYNAVLGTG